MTARLPDFLCIGTQKGGTTSLHHWLSNHPKVFMPKCKEIHYFDLNAEKNTEWYSAYFQEAKPDQYCGETTPFYLFHPDAASRIYSILPNVKIIAMLRDPVERTLSQIFHARKRGYENLNPEEALEAEKSRLEKGDIYSLQKHSYVSRSRYIEQLDRYETKFSKKQMLVIKSEDFFTNSEKCRLQIQEFLGLKSYLSAKTISHENRGEDQSNYVSHGLRNKLREELRDTAIGIQKRYGFGWDWTNKQTK